MKKWTIVFFMVLLWVVPSSWALDGRNIIETQRDRHGVESAQDYSVMLLIDKKGKRNVREIKRYGKKLENGLHRSMLVFTLPKDLKGTALLTWEIAPGEYKQWLCLPDKKSLQRISSQSNRTPFMGSDFTYEDMQPDTLDNYLFSSPDTQVLDDKECFVIDITPATREIGKKSAYGKRRVWIQKDIYFTVKIQFFDRRNNLMKTQTSHSLKNSHGTVWYAQKVLMDNHRKNHKTLLGIKTKQVNLDIADGFFTEKTILSGKHL